MLREAYQEISTSLIIYPVNTFLRLPLYLQEAHRNDEAWREFNILLTQGYPHQISDPKLIPMDHSIIYDKMRLFLQRENQNDLAIRFGIFSYLSWAIGLYRQERTDELKIYISESHFKNVIKKLLKKAKKEYLINTVSSIVEKQVDNLPNINFGNLTKRIDEVVLR